MKNLTLEHITQVCGGTYYGPADKMQEEVQSVVTDSRKADKGCLFVPIVGERVDAHRFIPQVMEAGALATLSEHVLESADFPYIVVESDPGSWDYRKCRQDQHQGSDCFCTQPEIPHFENTRKL